MIFHGFNSLTLTIIFDDYLMFDIDYGFPWLNMVNHGCMGLTTFSDV